MRAILSLLLAAIVLLGADRAKAASAQEIDAEADIALSRLTSEAPVAKELMESAAGVLVFPSIIKGGFGIGGEYGEGALRQDGVTTAYYNIASVSYGFQIGAQGYSQVLIFTTDEALDYLSKSQGFEIGADAGVALANVGAGGELSSTTLQSPIVAFVFGQKGLMAGISIEGSKITQIER